MFDARCGALGSLGPTTNATSSHTMAEAEAAAAAELAARVAQRERNLSPTRLADATLKSLDSSMKKVTAFLKKVKERLGEETRAQLVTELAKLNLSKYVEEVALGVSEAQLKLKDLAAAAEVCSVMHASYNNFAAALLPHLRKNATITPPPPAKPGAPPATPESDSERSARLAKKRVALRLLFELLAVGLFQEASPALTCLAAVVKEEGLPSSDPTPTPMPNIAVLSSLAKAVAADPLLISPAVRAATAEAAATGTTAVAASEGAEEAAGGGGGEGGGGGGSSPAMSESEQRRLLAILTDYFGAACKALQDGYSHLRNVEKANQRALSVKGDLTDEAAAAYERAKRGHERLLGGCSTLSEALLRPLPPLEEEPKPEAAKKMDVTVHGAADASGEGDEVYEDAESRAFYEQLPDLQAVLPAVLFAAEEGAKSSTAEGKEAVEKLLGQMPALASKAEVDELASQLVVARVRGHVRAVVRALSSPPPPSPELGPVHLPRYARLAAVLSSCFRQIGTELVAVVLDDFDEVQQRVPRGGGGGAAAGKGGGKGGGGKGGGGKGGKGGGGKGGGKGGGYY